MAVGKKKCSKLPLSFLLLYKYLFSYFILIQQKGCACNAAFNMLYAGLCTCRTDYIDMNIPEKACFSYWLTGKSDKTLNVQYILHLKQHIIKVIVNTVFSQVLAYFLINDGSVSSNYDIDMTSINIRMFGIMFEVSLLVASLKISTFMKKPLFIHTSEKL